MKTRRQYRLSIWTINRLHRLKAHLGLSSDTSVVELAINDLADRRLPYSIALPGGYRVEQRIEATGRWLVVVAPMDVDVDRVRIE